MDSSPKYRPAGLQLHLAKQTYEFSSHLILHRMESHFKLVTAKARDGSCVFQHSPFGNYSNTKIAQDSLIWVAEASVCQEEGMAFGSRGGVHQ